MLNWQQILEERLAVFGHRNWIVVADSAYPAHSLAGIETVPTNRNHWAVLEAVLAELTISKHVKPVVYTDQELQSVPETDAPGISEYRDKLADLLKGVPVHQLPHDEIIARLDEAGKTFRVLILKTDLTIPYTSVFMELDCGYWSSEAETRLREAMKKSGTAKP